ncbi:non-ribosomal peptide synthetase [Methylobacter sp.]|uniref:amino acid adenylation domain-containing protein n=1 Tax=Methylobacter sp. TaxID=2051955 RepID=UPI001217B18B|nr:non-ribosomal peptide synthetase [Methylobacter sp.]TAK60284.1 MAG: non-ribosomal peptide synthetase [Methylobacter sp.]
MTNRQDKLAQLTPAQKALLLKKLAAKNLTSEPKHTVPVRAEGCLIPMTSSQQRLWFLQRYTGSSSLYNMPIFLRLQGALNRQAMEKAFAKVFERHELLRTRFYQTDEGFFQQLNAAEPFKLNAIDLTGIEMQAERLQAVLQEMTDYSFDLEQGELIQLRLIKLAQDEYVLATCAHHIITDGWSVNVFMRDFAAFYQAELKQEPAVLPALPIQFTDYAVWQQQVLASSAGEQDLAFWQAYLTDVPYFLELPTDFKRPKTARHQGALYEFTIESGCKQSLSALAKTQQVSVYVLLLSAFAVLLARYSGQRQLLIGTPFAGRNYKELEDLIGFFVNSLPIKAECSGKQSFIEVLQQTQQSFLAASSHQQVPFEKIVDAVQPERNESYSPLFQVMFTYINEAANADALADLSVQLIPSARTSAKFDLTLSIQEQDRLLSGLVEYDTDLFEQASIERMMTAYLNILKAVVSKPDVLIEQIDLLSAEDYQRIVYDWNDCRTDFPRHRTVPQQFQLQVQQRPEHIALIHGERQLTYRQLNEQANQLAHVLIKHGVKAGDYVALYLQRGCDLVIAMMATLKAGAAYLPLDMAYPLERLALMHRQIDIAITLTQQSLLASAQVFGQTEILAVDQLDKQSYSTIDPSCSYANALAYVMFTSGSTGNPKGIGITHASINRLVLDTNYIDLNPNDRVAQANNTAFDASTFETWGALLNGACLAIAERETSLSVTDFVSFLRTQKITILLLTTALFNQIIRQQPDAFAGLRYVLFGGEKVDPEQVKTVLEHGKPEHFLHIYGPTESTTFASWYEIDSVSDTALTVPIGWPLANTRLYILDTQLKPVPVGVSGELYIAGEGLSPCYINQPIETAAKYVPDVFSKQPGERMYRSGDIVRWNNNGVIEFIGRVDHQVKIRGVRIELGAVETVINAYPSVKQSYVRVKDIAGQGKCLIAYFSSREQQQVDVPRLRLHLQSALPDYMVPAALVSVPNLPLTPNGKIDEKALPEPNSEHYHQTVSEPPVTDTEIKLAQLWEPLLGVQVKRDSDFFLLGGHSILVMQLANRIQNTFGIKLLIRELFEKSILREQAKAIDASGNDAVPILSPAAKADDYPLSFSQERLYFLQQLYPDSSAYNMVTALKITGPLDVDCLQACFDRIISRHSVLTTVFVLKNARPRQKILDVSQLPIEHLDWSADDSQTQQIKLDQLLEQETNYVFRLDRLPLIRVQVIKTGAQDHVLVINNHHIMSDGWSQSVFMKEWLSLYQAAILGTQAQLPTLSVQYVDYAVWQRQLLNSERLEQLLAYWRSTLADMPPALNLTTDFARPAVQTFSAQSETFSLDAELTLALNQLAEQQHCSVFVLLLAGFNLFLARYSGQYDFAVGTPVANRNHQETENLIGFFVNTLVLRNRIEGDPLWLEFLAQVKDTVIDAFAHQELPFEKLVEALQPERDLSNTPFFQVMFLFHNAASQMPRLTGLEIEPLPLDSKEVKFDLTLAMHELDGQLVGTFEYNADLFKAERIQIMCRGFAHLLQQLTRKPEKRIGDFSIVDDALYRQVVVDWNRNSAPVPAQSGIYDLFAQRVGSAAEKIAVAQGETQLTYQELSDQVDRLADVLAARGAGPEVLIGLCLKRTPRLIVAMLAILKSGSAYVPLDPDYPSARLEHTLQDAKVLLLLTESDLAAAHAGLAVVPKILLDQPWPKTDAQVFQPQSPSNLAYVLYTSGSTGKPKGVAITHSNAVAMIGWAQSVYQPEQLSRMLVGTSICFDLSVFEIFLTLATGGTLVLLRNVLELAEQPNCAPSLINTVPSAAEELLRVNAIPESVKTVNLAGEPLSAELVNKLYAKAHIEKVYDLYGPSEDTTYSTYCLRQANAQPSIGRPISNSSAYVLDAYLQPLPPGVPGELYLGGMGLARGYHGRPALTAEKFVPNPFSQQAGERLYRTGDLVSYSAEGELTYLGRLDHQVKVRGYRIELGEVEAVLKSVAGVDDCVVLTVGEAAASDRKLVAYVSASAEHSYTDLEANLMQIVKEQLPRFMVPSAIVILERLPLTANGKLDRKALPDPELNSVKATQVLPVGFVQQTLVGIWREILALDQAISVDDDFFELGGHSLLVLDLMTQIKVALGKTLPLAAIFQAPTISALSQLIDKDHQEAEWTPLVSLKTKGDAPALFCFHPVGGHVICYNELAKALPDDQPVYGLRAPGMESDQSIMTQLPEMAAYYLKFIKTIQKQGGYRLLGYSFGGLLAYEVARQLEAMGDTVDFVGLLDTAHPELTAHGAAKTDDAELLVSLFPGLGYTAELLRTLPKSEQLTQVFSRAKQAGLVPRAMDDEAIERYFNVCRSMLQMTYRPQKINAPVTLIRAQEGSRRITADDYLTWQQVSGLNMTLHWLSGQHENMMEQPHVGKIAQVVEDLINIKIKS